VVFGGRGPFFFDNSVWDLDSGTEVAHDLPVGQSILLDEATLVAFYEDLTASRYSLASNQRIPPDIPFDPLAFHSLSWNFHAGLFAVGYPDRIDLFDVAHGRPLELPREFVEPVPDRIQFDDTGRLAASILPDQSLVVREVGTGRSILGPVPDVVSAAFAPDETLVVLRSDGELGRLDLTTGEQIAAYPMQNASVRVKPREHLVLTILPGRSAALFDLDSGIQIGEDFPIVEFPAAITSGDLSDGERYLALAGVHGVDVWDLRLERWREAACELAGRNLTRAEWERYLPTNEPYRETCPTG
jgi:hypothetical protein